MRYAEEVKANDGPTLTFTLDPKPDPFVSARFVMKRSTEAGMVAVVARDVDEYDPASGIVTVVLDPSETAEPGWYRAEVEVTPGPVTYPSSGWFVLRVVPDLG